MSVTRLWNILVLKVSQGIILKVIRPLYSIPKVGNYWFKTYYNYYIKELNMSQFTYNLCLLYLNNFINFETVGL
jgi:hypothetical protein